MGVTDSIQTLSFADIPGGGSAGGFFELGYGEGRAWVAVGANENDTAANIQTALEGMAGIGSGNVSVVWRAADSRYEITFSGTAADQVTFIQGATELPGAAVVAHDQTMVQRISFTTAQHTEGEAFTLDLGADLGQVGLITVRANGAATAAEIKSALDNHLSAQSITVTVTPSSDATYTHYNIEFEGAAVEVNRIQKLEFGGGVEDDYGFTHMNATSHYAIDRKVAALQIYETEQHGEDPVFGEPGRFFRLCFYTSAGDEQPFTPHHFTGPITVGADAVETVANIQGAMNSLMTAHPGNYPGNVTVSWIIDGEGYYPRFFDGNYYRFNFSQPQTYEIANWTSQSFEAGENETQLIQLAAANDYQLLVFDAANPSGAFTLSYDGTATEPIAIGSSYGETAANIQATLRERFGDSGIRVSHRDDAVGNTVYAIDFTGSGTNPTGVLVYSQGPAFTGGAGTIMIEQAGVNGPALADLLDLRVAAGSEGQVITVGSSTLLDEFYISHAAGNLAGLDTTLSEVDRFYGASGNFFLTQPQTITLVQGDGRRAEVTLFGSDSMAEIETKLNEAVHYGLGQKEYTAGLFNPTTFAAGREGIPAYVRYVAPNEGEPTGLFSVEGTFVIQSAVTGQSGEIIFSGDERILNALSLTTIREAQESFYYLQVSDAHSGDIIAADQKVSNNIMIGVVHDNVDVAFDSMANTLLASNGTAFAWESDSASYHTFVHLANNTMTFHIGANPLQDTKSAIGDMSAEALGVDNIFVLNRSSANQAMAKLDSAIDLVSSERAKMGAIQNRLEHTIKSIDVAAENLTAAESRIRDVDFASEITELTRTQLLQQTSTAILAQANMKPQVVLALIA
jgi:flagellin-like hook-associated protein FlgL